VNSIGMSAFSLRRSLVRAKADQPTILDRSTRKRWPISRRVRWIHGVQNEPRENSNHGLLGCDAVYGCRGRTCCLHILKMVSYRNTTRRHDPEDNSLITKLHSEAARSSEKLVPYHKTTLRHNPENHDLIAKLQSEDGRNKVLRSVGILSHHYMSQPRRPRLNSEASL
jgi:hypothetical protein